MKSNKNPYLKTQIAIVKTLVDGSKKSQNQIARETDYEKSTISKALDDLEKRKVIIRKKEKIKSGYTNKGKYDNKLCHLAYEVDRGINIIKFLRETLEKYPSLTLDLQKNDKILSILIYKHVSEVCTDEWLSEVQTRDFENRLRISATFFKLYLLKEPGELRGTFNTLFSITERGQEFEQYNRDIMRGVWETEKQIEGNPEKEYKPRNMNIQSLGFAQYQPCFNDLIDVVFKACVYSDILNEKDSSSEIEYIKKMLSHLR